MLTITETVANDTREVKVIGGVWDEKGGSRINKDGEQEHLGGDGGVRARHHVILIIIIIIIIIIITIMII